MAIRDQGWSGRNEAPVRQPPTSISIRFYENREKRILRKELLWEDANTIAATIKRSEMKDSQLRSFYNQVLLHKAAIEADSANTEAFLRELPYIRMLVTKGLYKKSRNLATDPFIEFLQKGLAEVQDYEDYKVFCALFEAVVGLIK